MFITTQRTNVWAAPIPEDIMRYIVCIYIFGDGVASETIDLEKLEENLAYTMFMDDVPVQPPERAQIPQEYHVDSPILVLEGGTNLTGTVLAGRGMNVTVIYWDSEATSEI